MSKQVHAPPTDAEYETIPRNRTVPVAYTTWLEDDGWCSSCRRRPLRVAHMGTDERNFALCSECLTRLTETLAGALEKGIVR